LSFLYPADAFREATDGLKFLDQPRSAAVIDNRYYNGKLGFTVAFPTGWKVVRRASTVLAGPNRDGTVLQMGVRRAMPELSVRDFAADILGMKGLEDVEDLAAEGGVEGFTARLPQGGGAPPRRVAVIYFGSSAFVFEGRTANPAMAPVYDTMFLSAIRAFRPMSAEDRDAVLGIRVAYVEAEVGMTFSKLAETGPVNPWGEELLRLVNGYYPSGEPQPGEWIKVFR
jgi:predicted Zn-dependent protease